MMVRNVKLAFDQRSRFLRHGIADASIALLIWLKRNLQKEIRLVLAGIGLFSCPSC